MVTALTAHIPLQLQQPDSDVASTLYASACPHEVRRATTFPLLVGSLLPIVHPRSTNTLTHYAVQYTYLSSLVSQPCADQTHC